MKTLILGNGPSVLKHNAGQEIDAFDRVIRFNNFETAGFEAQIGRKTTIAARRACDDVRMYRPRRV